MVNYNNIHRAQFRVENLIDRLDEFQCDLGTVDNDHFILWKDDTIAHLHTAIYELQKLQETLNLVEEQFIRKTEVIKP